MSRIIRKSETLKKTGQSNSGMYALIAAGQFPAPIKLSDHGRAVGWLEAELDAWIESRIEQRDSKGGVA